MQKLRLQNKFNKDTNKFERDNFEIKETEKTLTGKINVSSKINDNWVSKAIPFIVFKSKASQETVSAVKSGVFEADFKLSVNQFTNQKDETITYHHLIINEARLEGQEKHYQDKANGYQPEEEQDDSIPW